MFTGGVFTIFLATALTGIFDRFLLPALSFPFILSYWVVMLSAENFKMLQLSSSRIYYHSSLIGLGDMNLFVFYGLMDNLNIPDVIGEYLNSLGAIFLQFNILSGLVVAVALLIQSRITFLLSVLGFASGYYFYLWVIGDVSQISHGYIGYNFILVSISLGGFFLVPTRTVFALTALITPITALLMSSLFTAFFSSGLPIFSLPYIVTVYLLLYGVSHTYASGWLVPVGLYPYSPEMGYYQYLADKENKVPIGIFAPSLPFFGTWKVTQDSDGEYTHKGDWRHAWDFIVYRNGESWKYPGKEPKDFYSYSLPVLASAAGWVSDISGRCSRQ